MPLETQQGHELLIRISVLLEQLTGTVNHLGDRFTRLETQVQDVNQRGLLQPTAIDRIVLELEAGRKQRTDIMERLERLEDERLVWKTQFRTMILVLTPIYGLALLQVGKWLTLTLFGT